MSHTGGLAKGTAVLRTERKADGDDAKWCDHLLANVIFSMIFTLVTVLLLKKYVKHARWKNMSATVVGHKNETW